jgi:hypothetical protein
VVRVGCRRATGSNGLYRRLRLSASRIRPDVGVDVATKFYRDALPRARDIRWRGPLVRPRSSLLSCQFCLAAEGGAHKGAGDVRGVSSNSGPTAHPWYSPITRRRMTMSGASIPASVRFARREDRRYRRYASQASRGATQYAV